MNRFSQTWYRFWTNVFLRMHNISYKFVSRFVKKLEPRGEHPKHRLMNYHAFFIKNIGSDDRVLDIGCGKGEVAYDVAKKAREVTGIDLNAQNIQKAGRVYAAPNIVYKIGDATKDLPEERFDVVILSNVLEHIEKRPEFLSAIKHLAPKFLIRVPMINRDWITLYKKEAGVEWRLDNTHFVEYTFEEFKNELREAGFRLDSYSIQFGEIWAVSGTL